MLDGAGAGRLAGVGRSALSAISCPSHACRRNTPGNPFARLVGLLDPVATVSGFGPEAQRDRHA